MSAPFDYSVLKDVADDLIGNQFGTEATLTRASRAPVDPWQQDQGPPETSDAQSIAVSAVRVGLDRTTEAASTVERRLGRFAVTAEDALPEEVGPEWRLESGGLSYQVVTCTPVQPGDLLLLYFIVVEL